MSFQTFSTPQNDFFRKAVLASVAAHVALVAFFTVKTVFFAGEPIVYESAIKVDLVALPDKMTPEEKAPIAPPAPEPAKPVATPAPKPPAAEKPKEAIKEIPKKEPKKDADAINLNKKKEQAAMEKLKQMSALENIEKQIDAENQKKALEKLKQIKGNALSSGSELKGVAKLQHDNYIATVERQIRQHWSIPEWLAKKNLSAQIRVRFDEQGNVIAKDIVKSSGNTSFDEMVIQTVQSASPVPPPPEKFVKILNAEGILFGFPE